jgi:hypothetical protein
VTPTDPNMELARELRERLSDNWHGPTGEEDNESH